jgi:hypothetical protein
VEILPAQGAPPVWLTPVANGKNFQSEKFFIIFLVHLGVVELTYRNFFLQVHFKVPVA